MNYDISSMAAEAVRLLKSLISIPSLSREETHDAEQTTFGVSVQCST